MRPGQQETLFARCGIGEDGLTELISRPTPVRA